MKGCYLLSCLLMPTLVVSLEECKGSALGMETNLIRDSQLSASSSHEINSVGPQNSRLNTEIRGGAWCPKRVLERGVKEFLQVDLEATHVITSVKTQGRFGNGRGREYAEFFRIEYARKDGFQFIEYKNTSGSRIFEANSNTYEAVETVLRPPIIASVIRIVPVSEHPRTVCMRIELFGCRYRGRIQSYSLETPNEMADDSYDGYVLNGFLSGGLGQLTDGLLGEINGRNRMEELGSSWVGWKGEKESNFVSMEFSLRDAMVLRAIELNRHPLWGKIVRVEVRVTNEEIHRQDVGYGSGSNLIVYIPGRAKTRSVKLRLQYEGPYLFLGEITLYGDNNVKNVTPSHQPNLLGIAIGALLTLSVLFIVLVLLFLFHRRRVAKKVENKNEWILNDDPSWSFSNGNIYAEPSLHPRVEVKQNYATVFKTKDKSDLDTTIKSLEYANPLGQGGFCPRPFYANFQTIISEDTVQRKLKGLEEYAVD